MRSSATLLVLLGMLGLFDAPRAVAHQRAGQRGVSDHASANRFSDLGPEMHAYMGFIDAEEAELQHLYDVGEVPEADYRVSKDRLVVMRDAALRVARTRDEDVVPDLYILRESELTQVLETGIDAIRGKRVGAKIGDDWIYHGKIRRGEVFYVLERVGGIARDKSY